MTVVEGEMEEIRNPNEVKFKWDDGSAYWTDRDGVLHENLGSFEQVTTWSADGVYKTDLRFEGSDDASAYLNTQDSYELWAAFQAEGFLKTEILKFLSDTNSEGVSSCRIKRTIVDNTLQELLDAGEPRLEEIDGDEDGWAVWDEANPAVFDGGWAPYSGDGAAQWCTPTLLRYVLERENEGEAFDVAPGSKLGVAWVLRPSGSGREWISPDVIFFGAGDNGDVAEPPAPPAVPDVDGGAADDESSSAAGLIIGIIVGIAALIGLAFLIKCLCAKGDPDFKEPLLNQ